MFELDTAVVSTLAFAVGAGVATFFSPCAYPLLPGYVGFYVSQTDTPTVSGSLLRGIVAGIGVFVTFLSLLGVAFVVGHATLSNIVWFEPLAGLILLAFGILVVLDRTPSLSITLPKRRSSVLGFGIFGAGYALAAAGCVAPLFVGVLTSALSQPLGTGVLILGSYVGTVIVLMIALTVATGVGTLAGLDRVRAHTRTLERAAGVLMIAAGIGQLYLAIVVLEVLS